MVRPVRPAMLVYEFPAGGSKSFRVTEVTNSDNSVRLDCDCSAFRMVAPGDKPHCEHLRIVLEKQLDGRPLEGGLRALPPRTWVPVLKSPGLSMLVAVHRANELRMHPVDVVLLENATDPVGFIRTGSGRGAIRGLLLDWLAERAAKELPACTAPQHDGKLNTLSANYFKPDNKMDIVNVADLLTTGQCRACNEDLVPDL